MATRVEVKANSAKEFAGIAANAFVSNGNMHPGTVLAALARMGGTYLFRSFNLSLQGVVPGQAVLSVAADSEAPKLLQIVGAVLANAGIAIDNTQAGTPTDPKHRPALTFLVTQRKLEAAFNPIKERDALTDLEAAHAAAAAAAMVIQHCAKVMDPTVGFGIAAFAFIEGAKTAPDPVSLTHVA